MRWSGQRGNTMLNWALLNLSGSRGFLASYSCLAREAGTTETNCFLMSQHSTCTSELVDILAAAAALRFPVQRLDLAPLDQTGLDPKFRQGRKRALLTVCPCVKSGLCPSACRSIFGPSPVVFLAYGLYAVSKLDRPGGSRQNMHTSANCGIDASW